MKNHYSFILFQNKDLRQLKKKLLFSLRFRILFSLAMVSIFILTYFRYKILLYYLNFNLILYIISLIVAILIILKEMIHIGFILNMKKASLMPFIKLQQTSSDFYSEEISNGFIIQKRTISKEDITFCHNLLNEINRTCEKPLQSYDYLSSCIQSNNDFLIKKAVIYIEIIKDQLYLGNTDILTFYDKITYLKTND